MSTFEDEINALEAELEEYEYLPLAERAQRKEVIAATRTDLTELRRQAAAASAASTRVAGKHLLSSLWPLFVLLRLCSEFCACH